MIEHVPMPNHVRIPEQKNIILYRFGMGKIPNLKYHQIFTYLFASLAKGILMTKIQGILEKLYPRLKIPQRSSLERQIE